MERKIVHAFKRLRVLTPNFKFRGNMDELVSDLSQALEVSSCFHDKSCSRGRRRRGRKRRSNKANANGGLSVCPPNLTCNHQACFISEDSESSLDFSSVSHQYYARNNEILEMETEKFHRTTLSDTDDLNIIQRFSQSINIPNDNDCRATRKPSSGVSVGESDSVNENFSPVRPHRRRRKLKRMNIDCIPITNKLNDENNIEAAVSPMGIQPAEMMMICGKRKRSSRERSVDGGFDVKPLVPQRAMQGSTESSVSSLSSSESDTDFFKRDEGREADDEQSDFFESGMADIESWWEVKNNANENGANFEQIMNGCYSHFSTSTQKSYQYSLQRFRNMQNRNIKTGHRRLDSVCRLKSSGSSVDDIISDFLSDPNQKELWLPPLSRREKEELLNLTSTNKLRIRCEGHGPRKKAFLVKTIDVTEKAKLSSDNLGNHVVPNDIKRRKKTMCGEGSTMENNRQNCLPEMGIANKIPLPQHFIRQYSELGHSSSLNEPIAME